MNEIWKQIEGFPNYQVSNTGKVIAIRKGKKTLLNPTDAGRVTLYFEYKRAAFYVKQLVAQYFLGYTGSSRHIHLKDGDARNCSLDNIQIDSGVSDKPGEIWKPLAIAPDKYLISNMGRVKALATPSTYTDSFGTTITKIRKEQLLSIRLSQYGAPTCSLYTGDKEQKITVSVEVAKLFVPNPNNFKWVGFKNGDKSDCRADNLYWYKCSRDAKPVATSAGTEMQKSNNLEEVNLYTALPCEVKEEIWKTIPGFEDYEISNTGFIRSNIWKRLIIRKVSRKGFLDLMMSGGRISFPAKWLAVYTFFGRSISNHSIETLDGDVTNFRLDNLKVTYDEDAPTDEIWRDIEELPNFQISNKGRVRFLDSSLYLPSPRYQLWSIHNIVYSDREPTMRISVTNRSTKVRTTFSVARLVATAFVPNPNEHGYTRVRFKDGDYTNLAADNLYWGHASDDEILESTIHKGLRLICVETGQYYPSMAVLAHELHTSVQVIHYHIRNSSRFRKDGKTYILEQDYDKLQEKNS